MVQIRAGRIATAAALLAVATVATGCRNVAAVTVRGKVVSGEVGLVAAVPSTDPRLNVQGLEGASVEIVGTAAPLAGLVVAEGTTDRTGTFAVKLREPNAVRNPADFRVRAAGHGEVIGTMLIPPSDRRVLVLLKPSR